MQGGRYLKQLAPKLERLHDIGTSRDKAHNRDFFFDQYVGLLLLYFFNPTVTSLRGLQKMTDLDAVQRYLGVQSISRSALSEAGTVFDPESLREIFRELSSEVAPAQLSAQHAVLRALTTVDGSLLPALPRMVWALWQSETHRRIVVYRASVHYDRRRKQSNHGIPPGCNDHVASKQGERGRRSQARDRCA